MTIKHPSSSDPMVIGTRGSPLALAQAHETRSRLSKAWDCPEDAFVIRVIKTTGDRVQDRPLKEIGGKGLFTKEIEEAMLAGEIHIAVHSMKDMPTVQPDGLMMACYLPREDVRDGFVSSKFDSLLDLPETAVVGTSSLRRRAQVLHVRPELKTVEFRGNVQTRLRKLDDGVADCTFLAMAGLNRLGNPDVPVTPVPPEVMLPAIAQGAIGIECRVDDANTRGVLAAIHDKPTELQLNAERALLAGLDGSCETPIAGLAVLEGDDLWLRGEIVRPNGMQVIKGERRGKAVDGAKLGQDLAEEILAQMPEDFLKI